MTLYEIFNLIGNALIFWAALVGTASVIVHARVDWRRTPMGRHLMIYMAVIAAVLVLSAGKIIFGDSVAFQFARLLVFAGIPIVMTQRLMIQLKAQRQDRRNGKDSKR